jgi:hypothetical protein
MVKPTALQELVLEYFRGVDEEVLPRILSTLDPDCVFTVETHGVRLEGHDQISGMFERLWSNHKSVCHDQFYFVEDPNTTDIAVRFRVTNQAENGAEIFKSNCNFFTLKDGLFTEIRVYMAGLNTLDRAQ